LLVSSFVADEASNFIKNSRASQFSAQLVARNEVSVQIRDYSNWKCNFWGIK
jgi:hypothetical protein